MASDDKEFKSTPKVNTEYMYFISKERIREGLIGLSLIID